MCICQRHRDKCLLRAWQDKHRMTLSELVKDWERSSNGTIFPSWTLSAQWFAPGILNPPLWPPDGCASGSRKQWAPPTLALELNRGLISYLEMLPWVLSITGFILPSAQDSRSLQPSCSPKVGGCWSTESLPSRWTVLSQRDRTYWTSLLMQMSPLFRKLGLLTKDHYHGEAQWEDQLNTLFFPFCVYSCPEMNINI